jgi:hypothetical protein
VIKRIDRGRSHWYVDTDTGEKVPGVTSINGENGGLPMPALTGWVGNTVAEYAIDNWDELAELSISERLNLLKKARYLKRDAAANRGTEVHTLAQKLAHGEEIEPPEELAGHVESCIKFLDDWDMQPIITEATVVNYRHHYAGTLDAIADLADGNRWLLDWKTNQKGPYGDTAFQLAGYRFAEKYRIDNRSTEQPMIPVDACGVVWLRADGYDLHPYRVDEHVFRQFLYIAQVAIAVDDANGYKLPPISPPSQEAA